MTIRRAIVFPGVIWCSLAGFGSRLHADDEGGDSGRIRHVLVISLDGAHALDIAAYVAANPKSTLAQLSGNGVTFTHAQTTKPSDSIPATAAIFTGGTPAATGLYYDDAYNRKLSPPGSACSKVGAIIAPKEGIDLDPTALNGGVGIAPKKMPLDPAKGCTAGFHHNPIRVDTIFEVAQAW